ncbi:hypothetical protein HFO97_07935 [Rhizobium leguminosarum]|uniref:hypothetical protein n=1 Tax=Rhizobium leguminosarum TaxID=384 RepID=UPI001C93A15E|nr:hypothetical protein [Rhizobium leguminosarum]MBY5359899.1 hypothetical protein [Rhizobium leguminosarum]
MRKKTLCTSVGKERSAIAPPTSLVRYRMPWQYRHVVRKTSTVLDVRCIIRISDGLKAFCPTDRAWFLVLWPFPFPLEFLDDRAELSLCACIKTIDILSFKQGPDRSLGRIVERIGLQLLKVFAPVANLGSSNGAWGQVGKVTQNRLPGAVGPGFRPLGGASQIGVSRSSAFRAFSGQERVGSSSAVCPMRAFSQFASTPSDIELT